MRKAFNYYFTFPIIYLLQVESQRMRNMIDSNRPPFFSISATLVCKTFFLCHPKPPWEISVEGEKKVFLLNGSTGYLHDGEDFFCCKQQVRFTFYTMNATGITCKMRCHHFCYTYWSRRFEISYVTVDLTPDMRYSCAVTSDTHCVRDTQTDLKWIVLFIHKF